MLTVYNCRDKLLYCALILKPPTDISGVRDIIAIDAYMFTDAK